MNCLAKPVGLEEILPMRELYREEMDCQIIHDSLHVRPGWTQSYLLSIDGVTAGYGATALGGPWKGKPAIFEFYLLKEHRLRAFDLFEKLMGESSAVAIETQSNDPMLTVMLHTFSREVLSEAILYHDKITTAHRIEGAIVRRKEAADAPRIAEQELDAGADWLVELDGAIVATGGILFHYNRPYGDIFMETGKAFRRRGIGAYLVQELKRICLEQGSVPAARCNVGNVASRKTLQKAGFVPCGNILVGKIGSTTPITYMPS